jgi:two-component system invasion response regulator UvrY
VEPVAERAGWDKLAKREMQIMQLLAQGKKITEIAEILFLSPSTVSTHTTRIKQKMHIKSTVMLIVAYVRYDLASDIEYRSWGKITE